MARNQNQNRQEISADKLGFAPSLAAPSLGLDDGLPSSPPAAGGIQRGVAAESVIPNSELPLGKQGDEGRPYCPVHNCLMVAYSSKPDATHYKCPIDGCMARAKRARPKMKVPAAPTMCPQKTCSRGVALEVDPRLSNMVQLHMICPGCGFNVKQPRPEFGPMMASRLNTRSEREIAGEELAAR